MSYDIGAIESHSIPQAVTNVNFAPAPLLMLTWETPTYDTQGQPLLYLSTCNLYRDGELIHTFSAPSIHSAMHYIDYDCAPGERHRYTLNTTKDDALGWHFDTAQIRFIPDNQGVLPYPPQNLQAIAQPSSVIDLSWQLPDTSAPGYYQPQYISVYRDMELIEILNGAATSYSEQASPGNEVSYHVTAVYNNPDWESLPSESVSIMPTAHFDTPSLDSAGLHCHPNPFNPSTTIEYTLPQDAQTARIEILDIKGRLVSRHALHPLCETTSSVTWNGTDSESHPVASGIYFYRLVVDGDAIETRKMMLLK